MDPTTQVLPVNGSREALFAFAQTVIDARPDADRWSAPTRSIKSTKARRCWPGAEPYYVPSDPARNFAVDWDSVPAEVWARTQLLFVCSPGNPTGAVMPLDEWKKLFELSDRHGFVIASDECYSEIYFRDEPPLGGLEAAAKLGRADFRNLVSFTSLSKRSNVPGMRSGFVAGDAAIIKHFLLYRTYHGSAMSPAPCRRPASRPGTTRRTWSRTAPCTARKFAAVTPMLEPVLDVRLPDAGFYLWAGVPAWKATTRASPASSAGSIQCDGAAGQLPRARSGWRAIPARGRIRMALVADTAECVEAAQRIVQLRPEPDRSNSMTQQLQQIIDAAWENRANISATSAPKEVRDAVEHVIAELNNGQLRVATRESVGQWTVHQWIKKAVLLSFRLKDNEQSCRPATWASTTRCRPSSRTCRPAS